MLTLRVHLDPVRPENGPLAVIPGSHLYGVEVRTNTVEKIFAEAGDVLAIRPLVSHSSLAGAPSTQLHRRISHLACSGLAQLPDHYQWQSFLAPPTTALAPMAEDAKEQKT